MTFPLIPPTSPSIPFLPRRRKSGFGLWALAGAWLLTPCALCLAQPESVPPAQPEVFSPAQREAALAQLRRDGVLPAIALELPLWSMPAPLPITVPLAVPLAMPVWETPSVIQLSALKLAFPEMPARLAIETGIARQIADQYALAGDERAVWHYELLLAAIEKQGPQEIEVAEVGQLAEFYKAAGQPAKAAEVLARMARYSSSAMQVGNGLVEAARLYREAGDEGKAEEMYRKVIETPSEWGWAKGIAIYELASELIENGRHEEARTLLSTPITGQFADQIKVVLLNRLGVSYYITGEFDLARKNLQAAIDQYKSLANPVLNEGLETFVSTAQSYLGYMETWAKEPIVSLPDDVQIIVRPKEKIKESLKEPWVIDGPRLIPIREGVRKIV